MADTNVTKNQMVKQNPSTLLLTLLFTYKALKFTVYVVNAVILDVGVCNVLVVLLVTMGALFQFQTC